MTQQVDLNAIRARHAHDALGLTRVALDGVEPVHLRDIFLAAHADRGALLAEVTKWQQAAQVYGEAADYWRPIAEQAREALDRLAAITPDEIAQVIADAYPYAAHRWDLLSMETMRDEWRLPAKAVLALVRARMEGPR